MLKRIFELDNLCKNSTRKKTRGCLSTKLELSVHAINIEGVN